MNDRIRGGLDGRPPQRSESAGAPREPVGVFSGIQPSGGLHLGNYFGAIRSWVSLQETERCVYCVVDYHALTTAEPGLAGRTLELAGDLLACGVDPERSILFVQSHVPEHTELAWVLSCFTPYGDLQRMTQFKEKAQRAEVASAGLFGYPVLQAADILLYRAARVPVGEDQLQHLELARRLARRLNSALGEELFPEPAPIVGEGRRIMSLAHPDRKMSKSLGPADSIGLMEPDEQIRRKVMSAVTDVGGAPAESASPGVANLLGLLRLCAPAAVCADLEERQRQGTLMYRELKELLYRQLTALLAPIRERRAQLSERRVREELERGAERARAIAGRTMEEVRRRLGVGRHAQTRASSA